MKTTTIPQGRKNNVLLLVSLVAILSNNGTFASEKEEALVSVVENVPISGVAVNQNETAAPETEQASIQVRWIDDADFRGVTQTFVWEGAGKLIAIGASVASGDNPKIQFTQPQRFALDIQELNAHLVVAQTLASMEFTLTPALVQPGKYLFIKLSVPVEMHDGFRYGFTIRPLEKNAVNRIAFATGGKGSGDKLPNGAAAQVADPGLIVAGVRYGRSPSDFDTVFFLQSAGASD